MPIVISSDVVLSLEQTFDTDNPVIGWQNLNTSIRSGSANTGDLSIDNPDFPAANTRLPNTDQYWTPLNLAGILDHPTEDGKLCTMFLETFFNGQRPIDYIGMAMHNMGSSRYALRLYGATLEDTDRVALLHMTGLHGTVDFTDEEGATWTNNGSPSAYIDTSTSFFGLASGRFDGLARVSTPDQTKFTLGSNNFRITVRFNCDQATGTTRVIAGQSNGVAAGSAWQIARHDTLNSLVAAFSDGVNFSFIVGTTQFSDSLNPGWHTCVLERIGNTISMYVDGELEGTPITFGAINDSALEIAIGDLSGGSGGAGWVGWLDEFYMAVGSNITEHQDAPPFPYSDFDFKPITDELLPANNNPILFRFAKDEYQSIRIVMRNDTVDPDLPVVAVIYAGELLVCERKVQASFTPITMGRKAEILTNRSENGNFLGRIITSEWVESSANLAFLTPSWYREFMEPFVENAQTEPFFFAWAPESYPEEVGYVWLMQDAIPQITHPGNTDQQLMAITLQMQGIVETTK